MTVHLVITQLVHKAIEKKLIFTEDAIYARNQVMAILGLVDFPEFENVATELEIPDLLEQLTDYATKQGIIRDLLDEHEILSSKIMNVFMPRPSEVNATFFEKYQSLPESATDYFYELSKNSNYIQTKRISKNINYVIDTEYGPLDITINLSKPEKDPKQIAMERELKTVSSNYPKCLLCAENEGYEGRIGHPARSNHRMIRLELGGEPWFLQYSPYVYYNEHCIVLSAEHRDMKIDRSSFERLLAFVGTFPHYFAGSNADLPIVGGSILTHDHYQGGRYEFAMARAEEEITFALKGFPSISAATVKWPMSVIRLRGRDADELAKAADAILQKWIDYSDIVVGIHAYTGETRHNTITPIARMRGEEFELDLVLRNNRTDEDHPLGIFHPHNDVHHIKKENIGLIEVMGLAVLPARLETELVEVERYLLGEANNIAEYHLPWATQLQASDQGTRDQESVRELIRTEVGKKFLKALEDAGVYKRNSEGTQAFKRFIEIL